MSLQRYAYFILVLFLGYSWVYFSAWKILQSGVDERIEIAQMKAQVSTLEKKNFKLLYQVDDLAQTVAQTSGANSKNDRSIASVDLSSISQLRADAIKTLFQQKNYSQVVLEIKKFEDDFPLSGKRSELWLLKARSLSAKSKFNEAVSVLENILEVYPDQPQAAEALDHLSEISLNFEKQKDSLAYLRIIEKQFPEYFKSRDLEQRILLITGQGKSKNE